MKRRDGGVESGPAEGIFIEGLGLYMLVERRGGLICRTSFSGKRPEASPSPEEAEALMRCWLMPGEGPGGLLDISGVSEFQRAVLKAVAAIPPGETLTYGQVARKIGKPKAARAVGAALAKNPFPLVIPCHRVVGSGDIGGYSFGPDLKRRLLDLEMDRSGLRSARPSTIHGFTSLACRGAMRQGSESLWSRRYRRARSRVESTATWWPGAITIGLHPQPKINKINNMKIYRIVYS